MQESKIMSRICHKHVCRLKEMLLVNKRLYIVMEHCERGDLADYLKSHIELSPLKVWRIVIQICLALDKIHAQ